MAKKAKKKAEKQSRKTVDEWDTKYKKRSDMTDDEIAAATKRLRLENEFANQVSQSSKYRGVKRMISESPLKMLPIQLMI